jgi:hypothetical protein
MVISLSTYNQPLVSSLSACSMPLQPSGHFTVNTQPACVSYLSVCCQQQRHVHFKHCHLTVSIDTSLSTASILALPCWNRPAASILEQLSQKNNFQFPHATRITFSHQAGRKAVSVKPLFMPLCGLHLVAISMKVLGTATKRSIT